MILVVICRFMTVSVSAMHALEKGLLCVVAVLTFCILVFIPSVNKN